MSQNFWVGDEVVWNPSNGVGLLFVRSADAVAPLVGLPTGISPALHLADADEWAIDLPVFTAFVTALAEQYQRSNHPILQSLLEGFLATALVMVERGGGTVPSPDGTPGAERTDVSSVGERPPAEKLAELRARHARAMPV
ncbi:DUF6086 family protein [Amycolatopsis samaneae]|uniref:DUF6086 family protein n=1 Tax=Amycolatopsis samaneae TaxID=664691 RepID=A0ABW5GDG6_9PSEU